MDRELRDKQSEANNLSNLGIALSLSGDETSAGNCIMLAFAIAEELGNKELRGSLLEDRGETFLKLGDVAKAKRLFRRALKVYDAIGSSRADGVRQRLANG